MSLIASFAISNFSWTLVATEETRLIAGSPYPIWLKVNKHVKVRYTMVIISNPPSLCDNVNNNTTTKSFICSTPMN